MSGTVSFGEPKKPTSPRESNPFDYTTKEMTQSTSALNIIICRVIIASVLFNVRLENSSPLFGFKNTLPKGTVSNNGQRPV
jgi:hypothetical protein